MPRVFKTNLLLILFALFSAPTHAQSSLSKYSQVFVNVCLQHAPALNEAAIAQSTRQERFETDNILAGAGVAVRNGQSCNLRIGGAGTRFPAPSDAEVQSLAVWYAKRVGGTVKRKKSAIGGAVWYEVRVGRKKYGVSADVTRGTLSYWVSKR